MDLGDLRAKLNEYGISRGEAARALHLSPSALNKKLRGQRPFHREEQEGLQCLFKQREVPRP